MIITILGLCANLTSLILWFPQAKSTWENQHDKKALKGISLWTQIFAAANTIMWCLYGLSIQSYWISAGTIITLPLVSLTIFFKVRKRQPEADDCRKDYVPRRKKVTFDDYLKMSDFEKGQCIRDLSEDRIIPKVELLNWMSYEFLKEINKKYWDLDLQKVDLAKKITFEQYQSLSDSGKEQYLIDVKKGKVYPEYQCLSEESYCKLSYLDKKYWDEYVEY